jgi:hypothetical protein
VVVTFLYYDAKALPFLLKKSSEREKKNHFSAMN